MVATPQGSIRFEWTRGNDLILLPECMTSIHIICNWNKARTKIWRNILKKVGNLVINCRNRMRKRKTKTHHKFEASILLWSAVSFSFSPRIHHIFLCLIFYISFTTNSRDEEKKWNSFLIKLHESKLKIISAAKTSEETAQIELTIRWEISILIIDLPNANLFNIRRA